MINLLLVRTEDIGPTYWRRILPVRHLTKELLDHGVQVRLGQIDDRDSFDGIFCNRDHRPKGLFPMLLSGDRVPFLGWDMDDDLLRLESTGSWHREEYLSTVRSCLSRADMITASTPHLMRACGHPEKTMVCPNLIDLDDYPVVDDPHPRDVILFSGTPSHIKDVELIRWIYQATSRRFRWVFHGIRPPWMDSRSIFIPWGTVHDYPATCRLFRPRVCLAPLLPSEFNASKSPIKVWESATYGASVIASDTGPYRGHPSAIVAEHEPFTMDHLERVLDEPNREECVRESVANSWQRASGRHLWLTSFLHASSAVQ